MTDAVMSPSDVEQGSAEDDQSISCFPVSFAQQRQWILHQLDPSDVSYNRPYAYRLCGLIDVIALQRSLDAVVARHESLRTVFEMHDGAPFQIIHPTGSCVIAQIDLSQGPVEQREATMLQMAQADARRLFDLVKGPLLRATLYRIAEHEHVFLLTLHHIITDGWSREILFHELAAQYTALLAAGTCVLPELPVQYADYAVWQREWMRDETLAGHLAYWRKQLQDTPEALNLPTRGPRSVSDPHRGARYAFTLTPEVCEGLKSLSRAEGCTLFMVLLAAFQAMLHRYTNQDDFVIGTAIANRTQVEIESLIGLFANTLALRAHLSDDPAFLSFLARTRDVCLDAYTHQDLPFEQLVSSLRLQRELDTNPLYQVMLILQNAPVQTWSMPGLTVQEVRVDTATVTLDLTLVLTETPHGLVGEIEYNTDLFASDMIQRMAGHYQQLLEGIVADPTLRISELPLLTPAELNQTLIEWNNTHIAFPEDRCIHELFAAQAQRTPDAVAVVFGSQSLTYRELDQRANQLAHYLGKLGVGTDKIVGICIERSIEMVVGLLGILKAGAAYMPLEPEYPQARLTFMLDEASVSVILTQAHLVTCLPDHPAQRVCLDTDWSDIAREEHTDPGVSVSNLDLIYVIYTSGSTGTPKGVMNTHAGIRNQLQWIESTIGVDNTDRILQKAPFSFDASVWEFFIPLVTGACVVMARPGGHKDPAYLATVIHEQQITIVQFVPSMLLAFLDERDLAPARCLKKVICGGEALSYECQERFFSQFDCELINLYGPTEAAINSTIWVCQRGGAGPLIPIGRPVANMQAYVLDTHMQPVPVGVSGELYLAGAGLARGYLNRPDLTAERFVANPFAVVSGDRMYKTGDQVRWLPDGNLEFLGRLDNQVKIRGLRIELGEIESSLLQHPALNRAVVVVREDLPGDKRLIAYVVPKPGHSINPDALHQFLQQTLPAYMVPAQYVPLNELPLTPNGKVDRRHLPAPTGERQIALDNFNIASNPTEEQLAQIWADVLRMDAGQIGTSDNFFQLGGHSLLVYRVVARVRDVFKLDLPLRSFFESPTIAGQSACIHDALATRARLESTTPEQLLAVIGEITQAQSIHELFERQAERTPSAPAVMFGDEMLTYAELDRRANQMAHLLRTQGVGRDVPVGINIPRSLEMVVGVLGILKAGGAYVPLDPAYPQERLDYMIADTGMLHLVAHSAAGIQLTVKNVITIDQEMEVLAQQPESRPAPSHNADAIAYVIFTSGSTGRPKGVALPHRALVNLFQWQAKEHGEWGEPSTRTLQFASLSFDVSCQEMFTCWMQGGALILVDEDTRRDSQALLRFLVQWRINQIFLPFVALKYLAEAASTSSLAPSHLRSVVTAGEQLLITPAIRHFFTNLPGCRLVNQYGPSETHVVTSYTLAHDSSTWIELPPIGKPIDQVQVVLLDENMLPVAAGASGELYIGGACLAREYWNQPDLTAQRFLMLKTDAESPRRLYKTGDIARYLPDGNLQFQGRSDSQVKIRGYRIELGEIEVALSQCPDVREAVVVAAEQPPAERRLIAYLALYSDDQTAIPEIRMALQRVLPSYMIPEVFVKVASFALTPSGKVDRRALPVPTRDRQFAGNAYVPASDPIEKQLVQIWSDVLHIDASQIGSHDSFFELGGHSLLVYRVIAKVRDGFQVEPALRTFFGEPTIARLAALIQTAPPATPLLSEPSPSQMSLSLAQQRLWFLEQLNPDTSTYNVALEYQLTGPLNVAALQQALEMTVHRHAALRSIYLEHDGEPYMVVTPPEPFTLAQVDLSALDSSLRESELLRLAQEEVGRPFDLAHGPMVRALLLRSAQQSHALVMCIHHIVIDEWSFKIICKELNALYAAITAGRQAELPQLKADYADFIHWQNTRLTSGDMQAQMDYWRKQLQDVPALLDIPTDHPYPTVQTYCGETVNFTLSKALADGLLEIGLRHGTTLFMTLLASCEALLHRYSRQSGFIVGTPITNRDRTEYENVVGLFLNTLALRADLSGDPSFLDLLARVRTTCLEAYTYRDLPYDRLVAELPIPHDPSRAPLVQVMFVLNEKEEDLLHLPGLVITPFDVGNSTAKFELTLFMRQAGEALQGGIEYNADLFDEAAIQRMVLHYQHLLEGIVANPRRRISELPLLTVAEQSQVLTEWNTTHAAFPDDQCIHELFAAQAERTPDAVALEFENHSLTYRELDQRTNQLAQYLQSLGVGTESLVGVCIERSLEMIIALLGVLKAGGAYLPLDPAYPVERLVFLLADANVPIVVTQSALLEKLGGCAVRTVCLDTDWEAIGNTSTQPVVSEVSADNLAYVIYTSGSTGQPKGVCCIHRGVVRLVKGTDYADFNAAEVFLQLSTISFDASTFEIWGSLLNGARLVIYPAHELSLHELDRVIREHKVTTLWLTAGLFHLAVDEQLPALRLLHQLLAGGDVLSEPHVRKFLQDAPHCRLVNGYGPTEGTTFTTTCLLDQTSLAGDGVSIGRPIANTRVYVLDDHLQPVPIGVTGELYIGGAGVARGYLNRPELTAQKFIPDLFETENGARLYRSGDLASWQSDGNLKFLGRLDDQVKIRGFRVELGEVESVLAQHAAVREVAVLAQIVNPIEKKLVAYLTMRQNQKVTTSDLRQYLLSKIPDYMVPAQFVVLDSLPLSANGKVDRKALPLLAAQLAKSGAAVEVVESANMVEAVLANMWAQLLNLERVGMHDNFFEMGGNSLLAIQLFNRIEGVFSRRLPLTILFQSPTVSQLAAVITSGGLSEEWSVLVPIQVRMINKGSTPGLPFFCVHGYGGGVFEYARLAHRLGEDQEFFGLQAIGMDGKTEPDTRIETMAAQYIKAIRGVQPHGPYQLGGYCFGAYVAYEMACQLEALGERVALLALIEGYAPTGAKTRSTALQWRRVMTMWRNVPFWLQDYLQLGYGGIRRGILREFRKAGKKLRQAVGASADSDIEQHIDHDASQLPAWQRKVMENQLRALSRYNPKPYRGRVTLFRAQHRTIRQALFATDDLQLGWGQLAAGGVDVRECPGSHRNLHLEPHVAGLADQLRVSLDEVAGRSRH